MKNFGTVLTAMVTPFAEDGSLNLDAAQKLAQYLVANGNDGVVIAGTTGEAPTITHEEQAELTGAVREAIPGHAVVAGAGSNSTASAVLNTRLATEAGADAILSVTPYYNRPSQAGIEAHFREVAAATDLPIILYDIPARTGRKISNDVLLRLFEIDNIVGVKDAAGNVAETARLIADMGDEILVYSGEDKLTLPLLAAGIDGTVGVATHWVGNETKAMFEAFAAGDVPAARALNAKMIPSYIFEAYDDAPNPVPTKVMMNLIGQLVGSCRLPMGPAPADLIDRAKAVLDGLGRSY